MAKVVSFINEKGGVGKSTEVIVMGEYPAIIKNEPTLIIGIDPQENVERKYMPLETHPISGLSRPPIHPDFESIKKEDPNFDGRSSIADLLLATDSKQRLYPYPTMFDNLFILPANCHKISQLEIYKNEPIVDKITLQLRDWLRQPAVQEAYKWIIIDSPPTRGIFSTTALSAITHLIIPIELSKFSLDGLENQLKIWYQESLDRPENYPVKLIGVLPNRVKYNRKQKDMLHALRNHPAFGHKMFPMEIYERKDIPDSCEPLYDYIDPESSALQKSKNKYKSIFNYPDNNKAKKEMLASCEYIYREIIHA